MPSPPSHDAQKHADTGPPNPPSFPDGNKPMNRRCFCQAAMAAGVMLTLGGCSGDDDKVDTKTGGTVSTPAQTPASTPAQTPTSTPPQPNPASTNCPERCPVCGAQCWFKSGQEPHECPNGHYWKIKNGQRYIMDWGSGIYYDTSGHPY